VKFTKSIRWRLLLWFALLQGAVLLALDFTAYEIHYRNRLNLLDSDLQRRIGILSAAFSGPKPGEMNFDGPRMQPDDDSGLPPEPPKDFNGPPPDISPADGNPGMPMVPPNAARILAAARRLSSDVAAGYYFSIWTRDSVGPYQSSTNCPAGLSRPLMTERNAGGDTRTRDGFRETYRNMEFGDCILVGHTLAPVEKYEHAFAGWLGLGSLVVLTFGLGGAWFIVAGALRPVEKISAAAVKISSGDLSQRIRVADTESEMGQLASVLNSTFARLEAAFAQQKQFTGDAAHELRTPLAVLILEAQTALARERGAADYKESLAASLEIAQQMRRLTDSLLELSRFDAGQENLNREKTDLSVIVEDSVKFIIPLAAPRQVRILCDVAPAEVFCDADRLRRVVTNLMTNAIQYNREGGQVRVAVRAENNSAILTVADTGCGIAREDLPRVFERFYRANKSRAGSHTGLGLAICKSIVEAHGGAIEVSSEKNIGSTFTVRLPIHSGPV
jgi:two-component system, OmpR family, sensor kinase